MICNKTQRPGIELPHRPQLDPHPHGTLIDPLTISNAQVARNRLIGAAGVLAIGAVATGSAALASANDPLGFGNPMAQGIGIASLVQGVGCAMTAVGACLKHRKAVTAQQALDAQPLSPEQDLRDFAIHGGHAQRQATDELPNEEGGLLVESRADAMPV